MKLRQQMIKVFIGVIIVTGFIIISNYIQKKEAAIEIDPTKFTIVDSEEELNKNLGYRMQGFNLASEFGLVKDYDLSYPIIEENRTLRIEKAWNFYDRLFIVYSYDLKNGDNDPNEFPSLQVKNYTIQTSDGDSQTFSVNFSYKPENFLRLERGFVYKNRIYKGKEILLDDAFSSLYQKLMQGETLTTITLNQPTLKKVDSEDKELTLKDIKLNQNYNLEDSNTLNRIKVDKDFKLAGGGIIHLEEFLIGITGNTLYYSVEPSNLKLKLMNLDIEISGDKNSPSNEYGGSHGYGIDMDREGKPFIYIPPFEELPEYLTINFKSAQLVGEESLEFKILQNQMKSYIKQVEVANSDKIGDIVIGKSKDYSFLFGGLTKDNVNEPGMIGLKIGTTNIVKGNFDQNIFFTTNKEYEETLRFAKENSSDKLNQHWADIAGPIIKFTDEKNQEIFNNGTFNIEPNGTGLFHIFLLDEKQLRNAKEVHAEIRHIPYTIGFLDQSDIKIDLK